MANVDKAAAPLPIDTAFKLPSPPPTWPQGGGFATGEIDLGGLQVRQVTTFRKISTADSGAAFLEPSSIPDGFSMLGCYAQPSHQPLFGWVLVAKTNAADQSGQILKQPTDYTLVSNNDNAHFWLPAPPDGFKAVGLVVTASPEKPPLDKIYCVRNDFTDEAEAESPIWGDAGGNMNVYGLRAKARGSNGKSAVRVGTFTVQTNDNNTLLPLSCLINKSSAFSSMPNKAQIEAVFGSYAPYIYFHPDEKYLPSSVNWYFSNGVLLYKKGEESNPVPVKPDGSNLPQGGSNDGLYWLDLPAGPDGDRVKKGDLASAMAYLHIKPVQGGLATDIQVWVFYPFNGPAAAKVPFINRIELGRIGEHVGDWERVTLRISNLDGTLQRVYFAQHGGGQWVDASQLEFSGGNRFVVYSSRNGLAAYPKAGLVLQGGGVVGLRNDAAKSAMVMDTGARFAVVAGEGAAEPPWLNYYRKWGPTRNFDFVEEVKHIVNRLLSDSARKQLEKLVNGLPKEVFGVDGPVGPKTKAIWDGDENGHAGPFIIEVLQDGPI
ncbi:hypothetical protein AAHA92_32295 [Salvia divinorum]|uniref:DUF946 domain-containing protein n=1 Tax=Salvia divinorum TaxID=28513 RepID=A0ABD1FKA3_SALDI